MARKRNSLASTAGDDAGSGSSDQARESGTIPSKTQSGNDPVDGQTYSYGEADDDGFDIKTTSDNSQSIAQRAVDMAKGDGSQPGLDVEGGEEEDTE
jgi:hypothetical protein